MIEQEPKPRRFGVHASVIQLLALFINGTYLDGGITGGACTLASLLFWTCATALLFWRDGFPSRIELFFLRWGLLPIVLIGTPLLRPAIIELRGWLLLLLDLSFAVLLVAPLMYLLALAFGPRSPIDDTPPASEA